MFTDAHAVIHSPRCITSPKPLSDPSIGSSAPRETPSFDNLFRTYHVKLCAFALRYVGSVDVAEEVVEDVFLRLWVQMRDGVPALKNPKRYLYTAVRNQALKHLKHERVVRKSLAIVQHQEHVPGMSQPAASAEDQVQARELAIAFHSAVDQLPTRCREAYTLYRQQGLSYAEVAELMGISIRTVETQLARATRALRLNLAAWLL